MRAIQRRTHILRYVFVGPKTQGFILAQRQFPVLRSWRDWNDQVAPEQQWCQDVSFFFSAVRYISMFYHVFQTKVRGSMVLSQLWWSNLRNKKLLHFIIQVGYPKVGITDWLVVSHLITKLWSLSYDKPGKTYGNIQVVLTLQIWECMEYGLDILVVFVFLSKLVWLLE